MIYQTLQVTLGARSYPIYIGNNLFQHPELLISHIAYHQVMIVTQAEIAQHYLPQIQKLLSNIQLDVFILSDGEQHKNMNEWQRIFDTLLQCGHERSTTLIALGGGVVGDITGFAAACYQRGVNYIQIPTTLIAQVDAAIGGKTAINHALSKNIVGAFHQPQCVISDVNFLATLPQREYIAGIAEVIKYSLIFDADFFAWLEQNMSPLLRRDSDVLLYTIARCAEIKSIIVSQDECDQGRRNLLNFGHTFGHALEVANQFTILHGEAVAVGMLMAAELSKNRNWLSSEEFFRIKKLLVDAGLLNFDKFPSEIEFLQLLWKDKKVHANKRNFILLTTIGSAVMISDVTESELIDTLRVLR